MAPAYPWIAEFLRLLEEETIPAVYLRNHEKLPDDLGNDVDLLIHKGTTKKAEGLAIQIAKKHGWRHLQSIEFGPLSMFFCDASGREFLHVDLFEELEWHWLPIANPKQILKNKRWNGMVFTPDPADEIYLNIVTRLFYHGIIRQKHREQAESAFSADENENLATAFHFHAGDRIANFLLPRIGQHQWEELEANKSRLRHLLLVRVILHSPVRTFLSGWSYLRRSVRKLLNPPGLYVALVGYPSGGTAAFFAQMASTCKGISGRSDTLVFHSTPSHQTLCSIEDLPESFLAASDKSRSQECRGGLAAWFLECFAYCRYLLPARVKNRMVIRYDFGQAQKPAKLLSLRPPQPQILFCFHPPQANLAKEIGGKADVASKTGFRQRMSSEPSPRTIVIPPGNAEESMALARQHLIEWMENHER